MKLLLAIAIAVASVTLLKPKANSAPVGNAPENPCLAQIRDQSLAAMPALTEADYGRLPGKEDGKSRWVDSFSLAPVAALRTAGLDGPSTFGAGLDAGVGINPFVSIHGAAYATEEQHWRGSAVDEAELYGRANFVRYRKESFILYGKGGVGYEFNERDFGFGVGLGAEIRFTQYISAGADYTVRAWFDREKDSLARAYLAGTF